MRLGYSDSHTITSHLLTAPQLFFISKQLTRNDLSSAQELSLENYCLNVDVVANILPLNIVITIDTAIIICVMFCHNISLSPALTLSSLIPFQLSTWNDTDDTWNTSLLVLNGKAFVCPNTTVNLLASAARLLCPSQQYLSNIGWRPQFSIWSTETNEKKLCIQNNKAH